MGVEVVMAKDFDFIRYVMGEVWNDTAEDGSLFEEWLINPDHVWLECSVDGQQAGFYSLNFFNRSTLEVHARVLRRFRKHLPEITKKLYRWLLDNCADNVQKFITNIPSRHKNVISYAKRSGWSVEGNISKSYMQNGVLYDLVIMGVTRDDMGAMT
jgi:hypothetical protein